MNQQKKNFIQVKQIDKSWWFIDPQGNKFISMGVNHIEPHLWLAPYNREHTQKRYGKDIINSEGHFDTNSVSAQNWINGILDICKDLYFNTFAKHLHQTIDPALYEDKVFYIASFESVPLANWRHRAGDGPMPDIFSSDFESYLEKQICEVCSRHKENTNLIGYLFTDIPYWEIRDADKKDKTMIYPWINTLLKLGASSPGKQKWINLLQSRYSQAEDAATVWGIPINPLYGISWKQLAHLQTWFEPSETVKAKEDVMKFMEIITYKWYELHYKLVKRYDSNHLILGDKSMVEDFNEWMIPALKEFTDVIVLQTYNQFHDDKEKTDWIYKKTGKPIFNGDGSYSFVSPEQSKLKVKGWWTGAKNISDVAAMYKRNLIEMMSTPYMIGWHHCGILEQWDEALRGDVDSNENGFLDPFENYYTEWTDIIREYNKKVEELHLKCDR